MKLSDAFSLYIVEQIELKNGSDKTARNYRCTVSSLLKTTPDIPIEMLTLEHAQRWVMYRQSLGQSESTISHDLSRLKQVLKLLRKRGLTVLDEEHIELPKLHEKAYTWLDYSEVQQILDVIDSRRDKAIVACLFATGCRISELLNMNREDVQGDQAQIVGKGGYRGTVRFDPTALTYLNDYLNSRKDNLKPLFISSQHRRITNSRVGQLIHDYADAAGLDKNVTPHVFRHSFATDMRKNGADIMEIKEQLRHKRVSSTQIYTHINDEQRNEAYKKYHSR